MTISVAMRIIHAERGEPAARIPGARCLKSPLHCAAAQEY
jgi:hypothetical protein